MISKERYLVYRYWAENIRYTGIPDSVIYNSVDDIDFLNINFFKNRSFCFPTGYKMVLYNDFVENTPNEIAYLANDTLSYEELPIFGIDNQGIKLGPLISHIDISQERFDFEIIDSTLFIKYNNKLSPLIKLSIHPIEYSSFLGKFISLGKRDKVSIFDFNFENIYEMYLLLYSIPANRVVIFSFWFDEDFNIIRCEHDKGGFIKID